MKVALLLLAASLTVAQAQIGGLAVNADGSDLRFQASYGLREETDTSGTNRIYRYAPGQPEALARGTLFQSVLPTGAYVSDDGKTTGWFTHSPCLGPCMFATAQGGLVLTRNGKPHQYYGQTFRLSRDGRWLFDTGFLGLGSRPAQIIDLDSEASTGLPNLFPLHPAHVVANDGTIVSAPPGVRPGLFPGFPMAVRVTAPGREPIEIPFDKPVLSASITPDGGKLFVLTQPGTLWEIDRASLARRELYKSEETPVCFAPSALGDRILLQSGRRVLLVDGSAARQIYTSGEAISEILLAGDGRVAFVLTEWNRLVRIDDDSVRELYPPFVSQVRQSSLGTVPGSLVRLSGGRFSESQTLTIGDRVFPLIAADERTYEAQIPWDLDVTGPSQYTLSAPGTPFAFRDRLFLNQEIFPAIYTHPEAVEGQSLAKAAQADFRSLVSRDNPAPAGSTIHIWLTGLGPLDRPLATGERGPVDPPSRPLTPLACYIVNESRIPATRGLALPFIAYAPGLLGVYQVDVTIPADWPSGWAYLHCTVDGSPRGSGGAIYVANP
ncbi:MAG: hypothetical protein HYX27_23175 [Acidobacteria bacterium]|nr:hypothetical protein [Acidobacteriota bacterium]